MSISNIIKEKYGTPEQKAELKAKREKEIQENKEFLSEYSKKVHEVREVKPLNINPDKLEVAFIEKSKTILPLGKEFIIDNENSYFIKTIVYYFAKSERFLKSKLIKNRPDLNKGLLITGTCGFGKTMVFRTIQEVFRNVHSERYNKKFIIKSCNEIVNDFNVKGTESILNYLKKGNYMFDDFGTEGIGKYYGNTENVMKTILEERYNLFIDKGKSTHLTSNLNINGIREKYGFRVSSRLDEMFNIIVVSGKDRRN